MQSKRFLRSCTLTEALTLDGRPMGPARSTKRRAGPAMYRDFMRRLFEQGDMPATDVETPAGDAASIADGLSGVLTNLRSGSCGQGDIQAVQRAIDFLQGDGAADDELDVEPAAVESRRYGKPSGRRSLVNFQTFIRSIRS